MKQPKELTHLLLDADPVKYSIASVCQTQQFINERGDVCEIKQNSETRFMDIVYRNEEGKVLLTEETGLRKKAEVIQEHGITEGEIILDDIDKCLHSVKMTIKSALRFTGCKEIILFLTQGQNFRYKLYPEYKAGRPPKPLLVPQIEEYMKKKYQCIVSEEIEADDALGIYQMSHSGTVLGSVDKDLDMIPGWHFNPTTNRMYEISPNQGLYNFWRQVLTGDKAVDNIPGLPSVGKATADKILLGVAMKDMRSVCLQEYISRGFDEEYFILNCRLLWMLRKPLRETYPELFEQGILP